jgi:hypothetical protein
MFWQEYSEEEFEYSKNISHFFAEFLWLAKFACFADIFNLLNGLS